MKIFLLSATFIVASLSFGQHQQMPDKDTSWQNEYRASYPKTIQLIHTKLDVKFDFDKSQMAGKEWLTLQPFAYATDSVVLDAKEMDIKTVALEINGKRENLKYNYDQKLLTVKLGKTYQPEEKITLYFDYISKPEEVEAEGSAAITSAKGLYFINPKGEDKTTPTQIWTQGETESNSVWMITIDKPNQKTTQELSMTVPAKYVTLSNGLKVKEQKNSDGTRTDTWKLDLPHAPYLFFMGVGDYAVIKDKPYKGKEVSYYVEHEQAPYAKGVFGNTPEMIEFFSKKLGVDYPWPKYSQIVGREYVSGAMENTTATLHQESAYQNSRELLDGNRWEETIAHELFHHWFGDLVTTESWSNITVNESFANYSEYLWLEYKYGKDAADEHNFSDMQGYLGSFSNHKNLVRFFYKSKEDVFDAVSYNKGGRILHMLRNYLGDDVFFKGLNTYLNEHKFGSAEAHDLRLAFEKASGLDLNWFFNEWYFGAGQPQLEINYNTGTPVSTVFIAQKQPGLFNIPVNIDIWANGKKERKTVWIKNAVDSFSFATPVMPELINVDGDKVLLAQKQDNKSKEQFQAQWKYAQNYLDRKEALDYFSKNNMTDLTEGLKDKFGKLRSYTISKLAYSPYKNDANLIAQIERIAKTDRETLVRADAINFLGKLKNPNYKSMFAEAAKDSSYSIAGESLKALNDLDADAAKATAKLVSKNAKGKLAQAISEIIMKSNSEDDFEMIRTFFNDMPVSEQKIDMLNKYGLYLSKINNTENIKAGIKDLLDFRKNVPAEYLAYFDQMYVNIFNMIKRGKDKSIADFIDANFTPAPMPAVPGQ